MSRLARLTCAVAAVMSLAVMLASSAGAQTPLQEAATLNDRAVDLFHAGKAGEAIPLAKRALELREAAHPAGHPDIALSLSNLAFFYQAQGRLADAEPLFTRALAMREAALPAGHPDIATTLNNLASLYWTQGRLADAEMLLTRALTMREAALPGGHSDVAQSLNNLAFLYQAQGRLAEAEPLYTRALALREAALPSGHPEIAQTLNNLAFLYQAQGRLAEAEPLYTRALAMREAALPGGHPDIAVSLNNLALLYQAQGRLTEVEPLYTRALAMHEAALPPGHPNIANGVNNLAFLYQALGRLAEAEALYARALAKREAALPAGHPDIARSLNNLAFLYHAQGRLAEAEPLYTRALAIHEAALPAGHPDIAQSLNNLAFLYEAQARLAEAEPLYTRALAIREAALPAGHPDIAASLSNIGGVFRTQGRLVEAEPLFTRALAMYEAALPAGHPDIALSLNNLAVVFGAQGRINDAESLHTRALAMREAALPEGHPDIARSLNNLAFLYHAQGRLAEAEQLFTRALAVYEAALPADHPSIALTLNNLAALSYRKRDWEAATAHARRASSIVVGRAQRTAGSSTFGSARAARRELSDQTRGDPFGWLMLATWPLAEQQQARRQVLEEETFIIAQWAGQTAAGVALAQMASRFARGDDELARLVREQQNLTRLWQQIDRQIVAARAAAPEQRNAAAEAALGQRHAETDRQLVVLQARLSSEFPEYAALAASEPLSSRVTQEQLRHNEALVQFAFTGVDGFAWVITRETMRWVRLGGTTADITAQVQLLRCGLDKDGEWQWMPDKQRWMARKPACAALRPEGLQPTEAPPFSLAVAHQLYEALFGSIKADIKGKHLLIVPSGPLTSLPVQVLVTAKPDVAVANDAAGYTRADWLVRSHAITVLPSVASLKSLRAAAGKSPAAKPYIAFGNPLLTGRNGTDKRAWDKQSCPKSPGQQVWQRVASAIGLRGGVQSLVRGGLGNVEELRRQDPLPESADELCAVARDLRAPEGDIYLGARATEQTIKGLSTAGELKRHAIVHFATHGLLAGETESFARSLAEPALLLTPPPSASEQDDGLLTASEVAQLELNADWVILSACNTAGAGDTLGAEALSGLARAFFYAGARALLVSHWYVDSDGAVKLTTRAVSELRRDPTIGRADALRRAMLALMADTQRPADWMPAAHPAVWAPFVLVGEGGR